MVSKHRSFIRQVLRNRREGSQDGQKSLWCSLQSRKNGESRDRHFSCKPMCFLSWPMLTEVASPLVDQGGNGFMMRGTSAQARLKERGANRPCAKLRRFGEKRFILFGHFGVETNAAGAAFRICVFQSISGRPNSEKRSRSLGNRGWGSWPHVGAALERGGAVFFLLLQKKKLKCPGVVAKLFVCACERSDMQRLARASSKSCRAP